MQPVATVTVISYLNAVGCSVENLAFKKESFINNRRQHKRHAAAQQWMRGHASRAVDGRPGDHSVHSCAILDNFYVEKPIWMVDLGSVRTVSGIVVLTWTAHPTGINSRGAAFCAT